MIQVSSFHVAARKDSAVSEVILLTTETHCGFSLCELTDPLIHSYSSLEYQPQGSGFIAVAAQMIPHQ